MCQHKKNCQHGSYCPTDCSVYLNAGVNRCAMKKATINELPLLSVVKASVEKRSWL